MDDLSRTGVDLSAPEAFEAYEADRRAWGFARVPSPSPKTEIPYVEQLRGDRMFNCHESIDAMAEVYDAQAFVDDLEGSCIRPHRSSEGQQLITGLQASIRAAVDAAWADEAFRRGKTFLDQSNHQNAIDCFTQALRLRNDFLEALHQRALALATLKKHALALDDLDRLLQSDSGNDRAQVLRRSILSRMSAQALAQYDDKARSRGDLTNGPRFYRDELQGLQPTDGVGVGPGSGGAGAGPGPGPSAPASAPPASEVLRQHDQDYEKMLRSAADLLDRRKRHRDDESDSDGGTSTSARSSPDRVRRTRTRTRSRSRSRSRSIEDRRRKSKKRRREKDKDRKKSKKGKKSKREKKSKRRRSSDSSDRDPSPSPDRRPRSRARTSRSRSPSRSKSGTVGERPRGPEPAAVGQVAMINAQAQDPAAVPAVIVHSARAVHPGDGHAAEPRDRVPVPVLPALRGSGSG